MVTEYSDKLRWDATCKHHSKIEKGQCFRFRCA
uniref:Uncharacterized protein n=1 Tax=Nelumbo nucifera TaxID=4432 RepID=A0A822XVY5_NELNU|nr:TPA_asm: hypothetical protein HUJ06_023051 [Nelumbo nucifera]